MGDLKEVEPQKQRLLRNTAQFVSGKHANNVLLTGARGTGIGCYFDDEIRQITGRCIDPCRLDLCGGFDVHCHSFGRSF